jgi:hypothetical protein
MSKQAGQVSDSHSCALYIHTPPRGTADGSAIGGFGGLSGMPRTRHRRPRGRGIRCTSLLANVMLGSFSSFFANKKTKKGRHLPTSHSVAICQVRAASKKKPSVPLVLGFLGPVWV